MTPEPTKVSEVATRNERSTPNSLFDEDAFNHGGEWLDDSEPAANDDIIYDLLDVGKFDQQDKDGLDQSKEETRSSWSSSEEALMNCEGTYLNITYSLCHQII